MASMERTSYRVLVGNPEREICLEDLYVDGRIILKWLSNTGRRGLDSSDSG
jgi:hypothetical protein